MYKRRPVRNLKERRPFDRFERNSRSSYSNRSSYKEVDRYGVIFIRTDEYKRCDDVLSALKIAGSIKRKKNDWNYCHAFCRGEGYFIMP
jgi:hypothetical protein